MSAPKLTRMTAADRDDLVAYLDGELPPEKERELDHMLVDNAVARQEVKRLADVYELLDYLPQADVSEDFTQTTMASLAAVKPPEKGDLPTTRLDVGALVKTAVGSFLLTAAAFAAARYVNAPQADQTLEVLPVLERLEELRAVEDRAFLDWLATDSTQRLLRETGG